MFYYFNDFSGFVDPIIYLVVCGERHSETFKMMGDVLYSCSAMLNAHGAFNRS